MKIFIDTNVLVSAFTARGLCADLMNIILADHTLMTGEFVLTELHRVLYKKLKVPEKNIREILIFLHHHHVEAMPESPSEIPIRDHDDRWVLESALRANADVLVTGDKDLLNVSNQVLELRIMAPREFWILVHQ